ncbi:MAG: DUF2279 domain-containing protein [bacterium]
MNQRLLPFLFLILIHSNSFGQLQQYTVAFKPFYPETLNKGRLAGVLSVQGALYAGSLTGLYYLWYKNYPQSAFHFYNDNDEWLQMDKVGHCFSAYYLSEVLYASYRWAGVDRKSAILYGSLLSYTFMLNIEILDGFSSEWGFSLGDLAANTTGCLLFVGQQFLWDEQRLVIKYSYHPTEYPKYRPDVLGSNLVQNLVKDYNGMSFWLSGNISSFLPKHCRFPKWLNVAVGYGVEGVGVDRSKFERYRQFYLSLDVDLTRIPTRSKTLKGIFTILNLIKIPCPAIEYNTRGQFKFHYLYF